MNLIFIVLHRKEITPTTTFFHSKKIRNKNDLTIN